VNNFLKSLGAFVVDVLETAIISLSIFIISFLLIFQLHEVNGQSMDGIDKFHDGQRLITDKITYRFRDPERGEVIIFKFNRNDEYIKRIIGLPGESIEIKEGQVYIYNSEHTDGFMLDESEYLDSSVITTGREFLKEGAKIDITEDHYVVMGDNRRESYDSRAWGFVAKESVVGRSIIRYWPPNEMGLIDN